MKLEGYLNDPCEGGLGCVSCQPASEDTSLSVYQVGENGKLNLDCERTFMVRQTLQQGEQTISLIQHKTSCMIFVTLKYEGETQHTSVGLDSGAQISCISLRRLTALFPHKKFNFLPVEVILKSAGNDQIKCLGSIVLRCKIGVCERNIKFHVIEGTDTILVSFPDMSMYNLVLNTKLKNCTVNSVLSEHREEMTDQMLFKPKYNYILQPHIAQYIVLLGIPRDNSFLNNCQIDLYRCDCYLNKGRKLCDECKQGGPFYSGFLTTMEIRIPYVSCVTYLSKKENFQAIRHLSVKEQNMVNLDELLSTEAIADPAGYVFERGQLHLESPAILGQNPGLKKIIENPETFAIDMEKFNEAPKCAFCTASGTDSFYCDVTDKRCHTYRSFKEKILGPENPLCHLTGVTSLTDSMLSTEVVFLQVVQLEGLCELLNLRNVFGQIEGFKWQLLKSPQNSDMYLIEEEGFMLWVCMFKRHLYFDGLALLNKVMIECQNRRYKQITFVNYHTLMMSERSLCTVFQELKIEIFLLKPKQVELNKIEAKDKAFIEERKDQNQLIDSLELSPGGKNELKRIFEEMTREEGGLQSVFSTNNLDVNYFHSAEPPHIPYVFDFQLKPEAASYVPVKERCRYVNAGIEDNVRQMILKLLQCGVVYSGYSPWNAQSVYVRKKVDQTLEEHLEEGGTEDTFVPGTVSKKTTAIRHCIDYVQLNNLMTTSPLNQEPPLSQLKSISADARYITSLDVTSMYYALKISRASSTYTGFNSGLKDIALNNLLYNCSPMGAANSVIFQNCALTHSLAGIDRVKLWADNIILHDCTEQEHIMRIGKVLGALKNHGLKIKLSKAVLCAQDKLAVYGFTLSIREMKIYPNSDKLKALKTKERPNSVKELKSLLGSLGFFRSFTPCIQKSLTILSEMTRKNRFVWTDVTIKAYEDVQILLSHPHLIFIHRSDHTKPIYGIVDSSLQMSAYVIYQKDSQNRPRVLQYDTKVLNERQSNFPPILAELHGLCSLVASLQEQYGHHGPGVTIFSDSRPLILICNSSHYNTRLARVKIYLNSLSWLNIDYQKGKSEIISVCDYFSRDQNSEKKYSQKLPDQKEIDKVDRVGEKFCDDQVLTIAESFFVMDFLLSKSESDIEQINDGSCRIENKGIIFKMNNRDSWEKGPVMKGDGMEIASRVTDVNQVVTRAQAMRNLILKNAEEGESISHPNVFRCLMPLKSESGLLGAATKTQTTVQKTDFEGFYEHFLQNTFLLDKQGFVEAQSQCPYYGEIISRCKQQGEVFQNEKVYFLHENLLFSKVKINQVALFKVILPGAVAYDVLSLLHRQRGHIGANKLLHLSQLYFEYKQADKLTRVICQQCWQCVQTAPIRNKERCDLPKEPVLLSQPRHAVAVDELLIYRGNNVECKVLNFCCMFSHHLSIRFVEGNLTSSYFLKCVRELKAEMGGDLKYLVTDGAGNLNSRMVHETCQELGLIKLTTSAHQHKSNVCELLNKLILQTVRQLIAEHACTPQMLQNLVVKAAECLNATNFKNSRYLSPHSLYFGSFPTKDLFNCMNLDAKQFSDKKAYFKATLVLQRFMREIREDYLRKRAEQTALKADKDHNQNIKDKIKIDDHVTIINQHRESGGRQKIFSNYSGLYQVVGGSRSLLYLTPCRKQEKVRIPGKKLIIIKVDKQFVKKVKVPLTMDGQFNYYQEWGEKNYVPKPLYLNEFEIDTFERLMNGKKSVNPVVALESYLNYTPKCQPGRKNLKSFKDIQRLYMLKSFKKQKKVSWKEEVRVRQASELIDFDPTEWRQSIKEKSRTVYRFLRTSRGRIACNCKWCAIQDKNCFITNCDQCCPLKLMN